MNNNWITENIPDLTNKTAVVTGGNIGLGFRTSFELARKNAHVIIACRSKDKGEGAIQRIKKELPSAILHTIPLDLVNPNSIKAFSQKLQCQVSRLDILVNNAGVVMLDNYQTTELGHEMHMATNHLGHFVLTGRLFNLLLETENARVVTVTSLAYRAGAIDFDDFDWSKRKYNKSKAYGDSKLANLLFMYQLQKMFESAGASAKSVAAHPGLTVTERHHSFTGTKLILDKLIASPMGKGVLPQLLAATEPSVQACAFYGPKYGVRGKPKKIILHNNVLNPDLAQKLWDFSEKISGFTYT